MKFRIIHNIDTLGEMSAAWDDLWQRSANVVPTARAGEIVLWLRCFAPGASLRTVIVEEDGHLLAALPLVKSRFARVLPAAKLPRNEWGPAGDLLLDESADTARVLSELFAGLRALSINLLQLGPIDIQQPSWQRLEQVAQELRLPVACRNTMQVGRVAVSADWPAYEASRSRNFRRQMRQSLGRLEATGKPELKVFDRLQSEEVELVFNEGVQLEDRGWKGQAGTSIRQSPAAHDYYLKQAKQLARDGMLHLSLLEHSGVPIAFEYGWVSKGVYFSPKVAYDESFAECRPGQLLRHLLLKEFHRGENVREVDFFGPLTAATARFSTHTYPVAQLLVSTSRVRNRLVLGGWRALDASRSYVRRQRNGDAPVTVNAGPQAREPLAAPAHSASAAEGKLPLDVEHQHAGSG